MTTVAHLWRHPIKSHGREALDSVTLAAGQTMPWDRHWAVTHEASTFDAAAPDWVKCRNFMIGTSHPRLAGIWASWDQDAGVLHLRHVDLPDLIFRPDDPADAARFLAWVAPLSDQDGNRPVALVSGPRGMTDSDYPSVSIMNVASHTAVAAALGDALEPARWRGNIWLEGLPPWAEHDWLGRDIRIGHAVLTVRERIRRCKHTMSNPVTGLRDRDTLGALQNSFGHQDFGVYAEVIRAGRITLGDACEVL